MPNFAVAAKQETIDRANAVIEQYRRHGEKNEAVLLRIIELAESELVKGTHPELEESLRAVDGTIGVLIKQINGVVAGQDTLLADLRERLDSALVSRQEALERSRKESEEAQAKSQAAEVAIKQAAADIEAETEKAKETIQRAEKDAAAVVEKANMERDQALRERDDAREIAAEKSASNDLLLKQMAAMETEVSEYKKLKEKHEKLENDYAESSRKHELERMQVESEIASMKKDLTEYEELKKKFKTLQDEYTEFSREHEKALSQAELEKERAIISKERELAATYQKQLRDADKENAKLSVEIEQLREQLEKA
jgi:hypothetical protein